MANPMFIYTMANGGGLNYKDIYVFSKKNSILKLHFSKFQRNKFIKMLVKFKFGIIYIICYKLIELQIKLSKFKVIYAIYLLKVYDFFRFSNRAIKSASSSISAATGCLLPELVAILSLTPGISES